MLFNRSFSPLLSHYHYIHSRVVGATATSKRSVDTVLTGTYLTPSNAGSPHHRGQTPFFSARESDQATTCH